MAKTLAPHDPLTRRERQIMDIIYAAGEASARDILERLSDPPTYATVRTLLRVLLDKGQLEHRAKGRSYIYTPTHPRESVAKGALKRLLETFYEGSVEQAVSGLLELKETRLDAEELKRIEALIRDQKNKKPAPKK